MADKPRFATRGSDGISVVQLSDTSVLNEFASFEKDKSKPCKVMEFSADGKLLAWSNSVALTLYDFRYNEKIEIPRTRTDLILLSPRNNYLVTWETMLVTKDDSRDKQNLEIWDIESRNCLKGFTNKKRNQGIPRWSDDEKICGRCVTNEIHFYEDGNFDKIANKLRIQGLNCFEIARGPAPYKIAAYVRGTKAAPSFVKLFQYPNLDVSFALAHKSFFKADRATITWNKKGTAALIITSTEVDQTGGSYYGEQGLHFIATNGDSNVVTLPKNGPIYAVDWNPNSLQFCVVYGYMPAKATLFNLKCESVFDFGTGPRNSVYHNVHGNIICLAGFGNLRGQMEFWDTRQLKQVNKMQASDSTVFEWCPDGQHFLTGTTSPRLREGNGYKIWHYSGKCLGEKQVGELWQVSWQPCEDGLYPEMPVSGAVASAQKEAKAEAYRPPQARGTPSTLKLHEHEPAQNVKSREMSASALKNKKKREAKARNKQAEQESEAKPCEVTSPAVPAADKEKKLRNLKKKLRQIEELKQQKKSGKQLEQNQEDKLHSEDSILEEIERLELS